MIEAVNLTNDDCLSVVARVRGAFQDLGLRLSNASPLDHVLVDVQWLGSHPGHPMGSGGAIAADATRATSAFVCFMQLRRVADALDAARTSGNLRAYRNQLQQISCDPTGRETGTPADLLFELEVAGRVQRPTYDVVAAEPDLVVDIGNEMRLSVPCKRPTSFGSIPDALSRARDQIMRSGQPGAIALSLDRIVGGSVHPGDQPVWASPQDFVAGCTQAVAGAAAQIVGAAQRAFRPRVDPSVYYPVIGVFVRAHFLGACREGTVLMSLRWQERTHVVANPAVSGAGELLRSVFGVAAAS